MNVLIEVSEKDLIILCREADRASYGDRMPFVRAADLGLFFFGGFDHAESQANGWGITFHDRGMNGRARNTTFRVPVAERTCRQGPAN